MAMAWSSPSKKPGCLQTPTTSIPGPLVPEVAVSSTSVPGHALPMVKVLLKPLNGTDDDVEFEPVAATRGAATNSQSRMRVLAAVTAAVWLASPALVTALWQKLPYFCPWAGRHVWPGAGVMSRPTDHGLPWAS